MTPKDELYTVDAATYELALGEELPVNATEIGVDRRGYAPDIAETHGADYMLNDVFIFGPDQAEAPLERAEYSFLDEMLDEVYEEAEIVQYAEAEEPLMLDIEVTTEEDGFYGRALLEDTDVKEAIAHAQEVRDALRDVTEDELMDEDRLRELYAEARDIYQRFGGLRDIEFSSEMGRVEMDAFQFDWKEDGGGTGFAFHDISAITYDGGRPNGRANPNFPLLNTRQREHTLPDGVGMVLEKMHDAGHVDIDRDGIMERRDTVAETALDAFAATLDAAEDVLVEGGTIPDQPIIERLDLPYTTGQEIAGMEELVEAYKAQYGVAPGEEEVSLETMDTEQRELRQEIRQRETEIETVREEYESVNVESSINFYQAMEEYQDWMPEEYHLLGRLGRDHDFTLETAQDAVKLDYITVPTRDVEDGDEVLEFVEHPTAAAFLDHLRTKEPTFFGPEAAADSHRPTDEPEEDDMMADTEETPIRVEDPYTTDDTASNLDIDFEQVLRKYTDEGFDEELQRYLEEKLFDD